MNSPSELSNMRNPKNHTPFFEVSLMRTTLLLFTASWCFVLRPQIPLLAGTPDQAYHRTPICVDGNCVPNRATNGFYATRWRPWPGGEPSQHKPVPQVGIELNKVQVPPRESELDMPVRPNTPEGGSPDLSPNDQPSGGIVLPPDLRNMTPKRPVEDTTPGSSSFPRGPMLPGMPTGPSPQPLLLGKKPEPLRLMPAPPSQETPADEPPVFKIRPVGNSQSGMMPEMVPWNEEEKNPIVRQPARISGNQVQHTIRLDEAALPDANEDKVSTIRVHHESTMTSSLQTPSSGSKRLDEPAPQAASWRPTAANAPAILPSVEARPLPVFNPSEPTAGNPAVASPLRGLSQGNPLRR
jgi:hypothetical protein